jgi:hypothetical protein
MRFKLPSGPIDLYSAELVDESHFMLSTEPDIESLMQKFRHTQCRIQEIIEVKGIYNPNESNYYFDLIDTWLHDEDVRFIE